MIDLARLLLTLVLGLVVGSFFNVVIYRVPRRQSLVRPPSRCPGCGTTLRWFHNIPVLSWLLLRGRCGHCDASISARYPIVEMITALLALLVVATTPPGWPLASRLIFTGALVVLFAIDLEHHLLPNVITLPGTGVGLVLSLLAPPGFRSALFGAILGAGVLYAIAGAYYLVRREEGLGMGDVKMLAMVGAFLGWQNVLLTLVLASFSGALVGIALLTTARGGMRHALPFGTFLAVGAVVAMLGGEQIIGWYLSQFP